MQDKVDEMVAERVKLKDGIIKHVGENRERLIVSDKIRTEYGAYVMPGRFPNEYILGYVFVVVKIGKAVTQRGIKSEEG